MTWSLLGHDIICDVSVSRPFGGDTAVSADCVIMMIAYSLAHVGYAWFESFHSALPDAHFPYSYQHCSSVMLPFCVFLCRHCVQ